MVRKITAPVLLALVILLGAFLFVPATPTAVAKPDHTDSPAVAEGEALPEAEAEAEGEDIPAYDPSIFGADGDTSTEGDGSAVPDSPQADSGAVPSDSEDGADGIPEADADSDTDHAVTATDGADDERDGTATDGTVDPDALPADAPRVCVILDMGAAACESFVHPAPGEVSVAVIYSDDDEHAIVETIAYDEHGPIDYVDFWEGEVTPSE